MKINILNCMLQLEIDTNKDMFQFSSRIEENFDKNAVFLHQNLNRLWNFKNFKTVVDPQELKELNKIFPNENILKLWKCELIIPINKIIIVDIYDGMIQQLFESKYKNELFEMISISRDISCSMYYNDPTFNLQLIESIPSKWRYYFID